jgi:hypothetical protein
VTLDSGSHINARGQWRQHDVPLTPALQALQLVLGAVIASLRGRLVPLELIDRPARWDRPARGLDASGHGGTRLEHRSPFRQRPRLRRHPFGEGDLGAVPGGLARLVPPWGNPTTKVINQSLLSTILRSW